MSSHVFNFLVATILNTSTPAQKPSAFNPRPPGIIQKGSATEVVKEFFDTRPMGYYTFDMIARETGKSKPSIDWALVFLRSQRYIEAKKNDSRNARYYLYKKASHEQIKSSQL